MTAEAIPAVPNRNRVIMQVVFAFVVAAALAVLVVLPAEYRLDLTGFGRLTGLDAISAPQQVVIETRTDVPLEIDRPSDIPFRSDTVMITVPPFTQDFGQLEYKISMNAGDTVVYSWTSDADLQYEFHGHTIATEDKPEIEVMNYRAEKVARSSNGTLTAPIDGIHGWYWAHSDFDNPVQVELKLSGYYTLGPGIIPMTR